MECYFDNAATTRVCSEAVEIMDRVMREDYGNPSSKHIKGFEAEKYIRDSAQKIASTLHAAPKEIIFTSGGTESNNMSLIGSALANKRRGNHIIASAFEHPSVYNPILSLEDFGFEVEFIPVDTLGHIDPYQLENMVKDETVLVSVMYVNNETGVVQDIAALSKAAKKKNPNVVFHCDAIQAYGKYSINPKKEGIDLMSVSGHKLHGPKGSGFLYAADGVRLRPLIFGGGQQKDRRSGTENVPAIAGIGVAAERIYHDLDKRTEHLYGLKERLIKGLSDTGWAHINAVPDDIRTTAPHIVSVSFDGIKAEVLLHALEERGIYVSSGSACSSNHPGISGTLKAIGVPSKLLDSTLRFSFCADNTPEEVDYCIECLKELVPVYSRFSRK
ncbi:MAG: cysteine desulfurase [Lachnospiraceae bacterium]|nr:cysteine desulfurase [Lachnospiraceae bacterium]